MNHEQARDELYEMFRAAWAANSGAVVQGSAPPVIYQGVSKDTPPAMEVSYARASVKHFTGTQGSLGGTGNRRFNRTGAVFIQTFAPLGIGNPLTIAVRLGRIALEAFEGRSSPGGIWFRGCRLMEIGHSDGRYQVNVIAEFTYDEVK
jgi:hypothetical protein